MRDNVKMFYIFIFIVALIGGIYFSIVGNTVGSSISWTTAFWTISTIILTLDD